VEKKKRLSAWSPALQIEIPKIVVKNKVPEREQKKTGHGKTAI